jgi:hypothetical protein
MSFASPQSRSNVRLQLRPTSARTGLLLVLIASALLVPVQPAWADIGEKIILRCTHNESLAGFTQNDYSKALKELSADTEEYSDCSSRIREAQLAAAAAGRGGNTLSQSAATQAPIAATPAEQRAIVHAQNAGSEPVKLGGGQIIHPGVVHANIASAFSSLPTPVLALLAFLLTGLLVVVGGALRNRVRGRSH